MRYQHWDVLLFPNQSRVPVQEFDTKCHVLHNPRTASPNAWCTADDPFIDKFESMTKVPILTCFVPSIAPGSPFRISIHSWVKPTGSAILRSYMTLDEIITFEARVYLDGTHYWQVSDMGITLQAHKSIAVVPSVATPFGRKLLNQRVRPGHLLSFLSSNISDLHHDSTTELRFPPFHPEILQQAHWEAGEQLGRVKIVISEGVMREGTPLQREKLMYDRLRDVVAFSFQHAPQNILEYSGIAWPNVRMFESIHRDSHRLGPIGSRFPSNNCPDAHAHSPQRSASAHPGKINRTGRIHEASRYGAMPITNHGGAVAGNTATYLRGHTPKLFSSGEDPFMGPSSSANRWRGKARSNSTDNTMPDYEANEVGHSRTSTDMSGVSWPKRDFQRHMDEAAIDEIIQALSPEKKGQLMEALSPKESSSSGLQPPVNTPRTADASKQASPVLKALNDIPAKTIEGSPGVRQRISASGESSDSSASETTRRASLGQGKTVRSLLDRMIVTRSKKQTGPELVGEVDGPLSTKRGRSSSNSSRKKRSLSHSIGGKTTPRITLRISPDSASSDKENQRMTDGENGLDGVPVLLE